jgi:hypothetical protein
MASIWAAGGTDKYAGQSFILAYAAGWALWAEGQIPEAKQLYTDLQHAPSQAAVVALIQQYGVSTTY